jgi:hypothetical protein
MINFLADLKAIEHFFRRILNNNKNSELRKEHTKEITNYSYRIKYIKSVLQIHDILVRIRNRISISKRLTNGSRILLFSSLTFKTSKKLI